MNSLLPASWQENLQEACADLCCSPISPDIIPSTQEVAFLQQVYVRRLFTPSSTGDCGAMSPFL